MTASRFPPRPYHATMPEAGQPDHRPRLWILANRSKDAVVECLQTFRPWLAQRADIVAECDTRDLSRDAAADLPEADIAMVLGGDGTLLATARALVDRQTPLLGINFGKLGFLAEFSVEGVKEHWTAIAGGTCRNSRRVMVDVAVYEAGAPEFGGNGAHGGSMPKPKFEVVAMNDAVVVAGEPFRMIEIELAIEPHAAGISATTFAGDGVIISTASGSTAYNLAAGGPIISPGVDALAISAICPQSLAFRPIVVSADNEVWLLIHRANAGTTLVIDGQERTALGEGEQVAIRRHPHDILLLHNPSLNYWKTLAHKMHWAARPRREG